MAQFNRKPVDNLNEGDNAETETEAEESAETGDEVDDGHSGRGLLLWGQGGPRAC